MVGAHKASLGLEMEPANDVPAAYPGSRRDKTHRPPPAERRPRDPEQGTLTIAAVPIGQPGDASARLISALQTSGLIAAEDTRRVRRLAAALGIQLAGRLLSYYDDIEARRVPALLAELQAGMPGVSDPGYRLVAAAAAAGLRVTVLPGPSAVTAALVISGLPCDRFVFEGFPPRRAGERSRRFAELAAERRTLIFFESPRRLAVTLTELAGAFGPDRRAAVCRELTKTHEEVRRGSLAELAAAAESGTLGEITIVIEGARAADQPVPLESAVTEVAARVTEGVPRRDAIAAVARELGLPRRALYNAVVTSRPD
jgi:16S rRNA (cytidine1402-2'-O)-methyltransferase